MSNLWRKAQSAREALGHCPEGDFFVGYARVISKQRVWDADVEQGNAAYLFIVLDEDSKSQVSFRASPAFRDCARAKIGDRVRYTYLFWDSVLPVNLELAKVIDRGSSCSKANMRRRI